MTNDTKVITIDIENLGVIKKASIEMGNLTIIAGENSTGKTNLAYTIWDILQQPQYYQRVNFDHTLMEKFENFPSLPNNKNIKYLKTHYNKIFQDNFLKPNEQDKIQARLKHILATEYPNTTVKINDMRIEKPSYDSITKLIGKHIQIPSTMQDKNGQDVKLNTNLNLSLFLNTKNIEDYDTEIQNKLTKYLSIDNDCNYNLLNVDKDNNTVLIFNTQAQTSPVSRSWTNVDLDNDQYTKHINEIIKQNFIDMLEDVTIYIQKPFSQCAEIATSDRAGIISFLREYQNNQSKSSREINLSNHQEFNKENNNFIYTLPIHNNIDFINSISESLDISQIDSEDGFVTYAKNKHLEEIYTEIEKIIGGHIYINQLGVIYFKPNDVVDNKPSLPFRLLSSSIKNLSMIVLQLKFSNKFNVIDDNTYYVIDEPEAFLHPENQVKMARIIAMMVNAGIKVLITTHSDYFIRELGALITIGSLNVSKDTTNKLEQLDGYNQKMTIDIKNKSVNVYGFNNKNTLEKQNVNKYGINLTTFDKAIDNQNKLFDLANDIVDEYNENMEE